MSGWALGRHGQRALVAAHIALACVWIGALAATLLIVGVQQVHPVPAWRPGLDRAVLLMHDHLIVNASYGFIVTGLVFSLFTSWGAFRLWWVALKWLLLAALGLALPLWVAPHVSAMAGLSDATAGRVEALPAYAEHARAVMVAAAAQLLVLLAMVALSVFKPWGARRPLRAWPRAWSLSIAGAMLATLAANLWVQYVVLSGLRELPTPVIDVSALRDGRYEGTDALTGFTYRVRVSVADGRIAEVEVLDTRDSPYARLAARVANKLAGRSSIDVDALSGATTTSKALGRAVADALQRAPRRDGAP